MTGENDSCPVGPSITYLTCLMNMWDDWIDMENLEDYLNYANYLLWVFTPLIVAFILPFFIVLFLYLSVLFLHVYKRKNELKEAYSNSIWDGARKTLATLWDGHSVIWHGYEIEGLEKIPEKGPALILYYHGALPVDYYYFVCRVLLQRGRNIHSVGDHFLFKIPGFKPLLEVFSVMHGPKEECVQALRNGHLLAISPGGVREAIFSDESYIIIWGNRRGFAQVAIDAQVFLDYPGFVGGPRCTSCKAEGKNASLLYFLICCNILPIIPMFTRNIREGFRSLGGIRLFRWMYETFKFPFLPIYGGFPVKLCTYLGDPIPYDPNITATELAEKAKCAVQSLIDNHQPIPGNVFRALIERFHRRKKKD